VSEFDIHEHRRQRNRELERDVEQLTAHNDILLKLMCAILAFCDRSGHDWRLVLGAACEVEAVDPGRMQHQL
jgi:hypothetical protein